MHLFSITVGALVAMVLTVIAICTVLSRYDRSVAVMPLVIFSTLAEGLMIALSFTSSGMIYGLLLMGMVLLPLVLIAGSQMKRP